MKYDDLEKLNNLREKGAITEEEYQREKEKILNGSSFLKTDDLFGMDLNSYCTLMHLSQFFGVIIPVIGYIVPLGLWLKNRDKYPQVEHHGIVIINWLLSFLIYAAVFFILRIIYIGFPLLVMLSILNVAFIIIGAIKAHSGIVWRYPLSLELFRKFRLF